MLLVCCKHFNHTSPSLTNAVAKWNGDSPALGIGSKSRGCTASRWLLLSLKRLCWDKRQILLFKNPWTIFIPRVLVAVWNGHSTLLWHMVHVAFQVTVWIKVICLYSVFLWSIKKWTLYFCQRRPLAVSFSHWVYFSTFYKICCVWIKRLS